MLMPRRLEMKKSKFSETQIVQVLKMADAGMPVKEVCRKAGISEPTYYVWKSKYGGMEASDLKRFKELEAEHAKLKRMYADLAMENHAMKDLIAKNSRAGRQAISGRPSDPAPRDVGDQGLQLRETLALGLLPPAG
jgi:putative transposase